MYKIGDKVETPLGIGSIYNISDGEYSDFTVELFGYEKHIVTLYNVNVKGQPLLYKDTDLKPYHTAHEKLIEMGFTHNEDKNTHQYEKVGKNDYTNNYIVIRIGKKEKYYKGYKQYADTFSGIYHTNELTFDITLSRILTQYLEELEE